MSKSYLKVKFFSVKLEVGDGGRSQNIYVSGVLFDRSLFRATVSKNRGLAKSIVNPTVWTASITVPYWSYHEPVTGGVGT